MQRLEGSLVSIALAVSAIAAFTVPAFAGTAANPSVVSDVQASTDTYGASQPAPVQPNTEIEPSVAVNPGDSNDVVTAFQVGRVDSGGDADNGFGSSLDGGRTWTYGNLPGLTKAAPDPILVSGNCASDPGTAAPFDSASDAVVAFVKDPSGTAHGGYCAYVSSLVFDDTSCDPGAGGQNTGSLPSGMAISTSRDGGRTWTSTILESDTLGGLNDKNWIVADNGTGAGHHPGRVYVVWDRVDPVVYAYCDPDVTGPTAPRAGCDQVGNWSSANNNTFYTLFPGQGIGTMPVVLNNGDLGVMFTSLSANPCPVPASPSDQPQCSPGSSQIEYGVIPGAGSVAWPAPFPPTTFAPVTVASYMSNGVQYQRAGGLPQVAYDTTTGDVFIGWEDNRFRTDDGSAAGSGTSNQNDAVIAVSTPPAPGADAGTTWSAPIRVNPGPTNDHVDHWNTMIAVGADGILRVGYRQRTEPDPMTTSNMMTPGIDTYYQESRDQGATFSAPVKVNTAVSTDPQFGAFSRFTLVPPEGLFLGDYQELAAGGYDETYVVRDEAFAPRAGATCNTGFLTPMSCQNQQNFVAHLLPQAAASTPDSRFVPGFLLFGGTIVAVAWSLRRRGDARSRR